MRNILILDTETTGTDPTVDTAIEVGAILYSVEHATPVLSFSTLIRADDNPAENVNRIPPTVLRTADSADVVWPKFMALNEYADAIVAHNADFDFAFVPPAMRADPWICTMNDIQWPRQSRPGLSLVALALEHDLGVAYAHRALADCDLIARLFTRARELGADLDAMLARAMRPKATFIGLQAFEENDKAKAAGFVWDRIVPKKWARKMAIDDAAALPFRTKQV